MLNRSEVSVTSKLAFSRVSSSRNGTILDIEAALNIQSKQLRNLVDID